MLGIEGATVDAGTDGGVADARATGDAGSGIDGGAGASGTAGGAGSGGAGSPPPVGGRGGAGGNGGTPGGADCSSPMLRCEGACVDPKTSTAHCGKCGNACGAGTMCADGQCCATPAAGGTCSLPMCGCATGQVCSVDKPETGLKCFTSNELAVGQACSSGRTCVAGAGCFGGVCKPYCQTDIDCPAVGGLRYCRGTTWSSTGAAIPGVNVCAVMCDPARPQSPRAPLAPCPGGSRCLFTNDSKYSDCTPGGTATAGQPCPNANDCAPGHYCTVNKICFRACATNADCPANVGCNDFSTTPVALGTLKVGYCGNCDPARPDSPRSGLYGCPSGYTCSLITTAGIFECLKSKALGGEGDPCPNLHADCKPGFHCTAARTCHRYCADAVDCGGAACNDFSPPAHHVRPARRDLPVNARA